MRWQNYIFILLVLLSCNPLMARGEETANIYEKHFAIAPVPAPDFSVKDDQGNTYRLADYKGKRVVLNFWATWCTPCLHEMPSMDALQAKYKDQLIILPVSLDRQGASLVPEFYKQANIKQLPILLDPEHKARRLFSLQAFPTSIIINKQGLMTAVIQGEVDWQDPDLLSFLGIVINQDKGI